MDKTGASRTVTIAGLVLVALVFVKPQGDKAKRLWGVGAVTLVLAVLADFAPQVVGPFAVLLILVYGVSLLGGTTSSGFRPVGPTGPVR